MKTMRLTLALALSMLCSWCDAAPQLTVVFVIDQFAYHYIPKLKPYFRYGLKTLFEQGVSYQNAHFPHAVPATATGHTALSTGTYARQHGIIANEWHNGAGEKIVSDFDKAPQAAVFNPNGGLYDYGKSAHQTMVEGISDRFIASSSDKKIHTAAAISLKSRAAIATANHHATPAWFDDHTARFTTSSAYHAQLPKWIGRYNKQLDAQKNKQYTWHLAYPKDHPAYASCNPNSYAYASTPKSLIGVTVSLAREYEENKELTDPDSEINYGRRKSMFQQTPYANQIVLNAASSYLQASYHRKNQNMVWISLSSLDKVGHMYGPNSFETVDQIYHLDKQLGIFMKKVQKKYGAQNTLFVLTADHGVCPIVELLKQDGNTDARRILSGELIKQLNRLAQELVGIGDLILRYKAPSFFIDETRFNALPIAQQERLIDAWKKQLNSLMGIKKVWTRDELMKSSYAPDQLEYRFAQQQYPGRSGFLTVFTEKYTVLSKWPHGTEHATPYEYDTHVPLVIYQPGSFKRKTVDTPVNMLQVAPTLARILEIEAPAAAKEAVLPGLFE